MIFTILALDNDGNILGSGEVKTAPADLQGRLYAVEKTRVRVERDGKLTAVKIYSPDMNKTFTPNILPFTPPKGGIKAGDTISFVWAEPVLTIKTEDEP